MSSKKTTKSKPRSTTTANKRTSATTKAKAAANKPKSTKKPKSTIEDDGFESEEPTANVAKAKGVPNKSKSAQEDDDYQGGSFQPATLPNAKYLLQSDSQPGALAPLSQNFDGQPRPSRLKKQTLDRLKEEADAIYENPKRRKLTQTQLEDELENDAAPPAKKKRGVSNSQPQPAHPDSPLRLRLPPLRGRAGTDSDDDFPAFPMPTMKRNLSVVYSDDDEDNNNPNLRVAERDKEMLDVDLFRDEKGMELHKQEMSEYMARCKSTLHNPTPDSPSLDPPANLIDSDSMSALEDGTSLPLQLPRFSLMPWQGHHPPDIYDASDIDEDEEERKGKGKDRRAEWNQWREGGEERKRQEEQERKRQEQEQEQERKRQEQEQERKRQEQERRRQEGKRKRQEEALERGRQERMAQIQERERKRQEEEERERKRQEEEERKHKLQEEEEERERKRQEEEELEQGRQERRAQIQEWEMQQERKQQQDRKQKELQEREQQLEEQEREKRRRQGNDNRNNGQGRRSHGNDKHARGRGHGGNEHRGQGKLASRQVLDRKGGPTDQDGGDGREQRDERERSKNESNNAKSKSSHSNYSSGRLLELSAYNVLQKHHATNRPVLPPRNEDLAGCRQKQQGEGEEAEGGGKDSEEDDGEDSETEDKKSRKRRTAKDGPTPKQEHFYPKTWQKVFAFAKDHLFSYLLNDQLFPKQELSDKKLATFLHRSMAYCEEELKLDLEQQGTFYPEYEDEMLWGYVSNFRGKCKSMARAVVKEHYSLRIWPSHREFPKPAEYKAKIIANVTALLHESSFHIDGRDAKGRTNNFMAPAIGQLAYDILYTGKRPLGLQLPGDFQRYRPEFITAILRCAIQEHETGHFKNVDFTEARYSRAYRNGLRKMDTLRQNNIHSTKTMDQWEAWRLEHILKGGDEDEAGLSGDEIDIQLD
ncbi:hypothetical protein C8F04DRAFT_1202009 [Mycena alexandri]|uniref:DUF6532 domain-containing protein n=1 Tax=Mycena alexandri TaxID=1745969 RepID=A0AAD6RY79_9AGAR|nr:hypothetical protein C8F04DRAFT_1202009 [Mycena alexandri]